MKSSIVSRFRKSSSPTRRRLFQALGFACLAAAALPAARAQTVYTWHGGTGNWETGSLWDPTLTVPNSADADVSIDGGKTGTASVVTMTASETVGRLTVDAGDTLNLANNVDFYLASSFAGSESIINNGTINFNSTGSGVYLHYTGANASLSGTGTINLTGANDRIYAQSGGGDRLTIGAGSTIAGAGNLGIGQSTFTNNGLVNANLNGQTLALQPGQGSGDFTNGATGIAQATNGGTLQLVGGGTFTGGTFRALTGSAVTIGNNANVVGTTLTTAGTGEVHLTDTATLTNVVNNGTLIANNNTTTSLVGTLTNNGTFTLASTGSGDDLRFTGASETLAGTGTLVMNGPSDRLYATNGGGDRLTIGANATITGTGNLGIGQSTFTNNGTVNANQNGLTLVLQPGQGNGDFTNGTTGVTEATNGGTLALVGGGSFNNGTFQAFANSSVTVGSGASVNNATFATTGSGTVTLTDSATLTNVVNNGTLIAANNTTTSLVGTLTNNATFSLNSTGNGDDLRFTGANETLAGTGTLVLSGPSDRLYATNGGGDRLTIAAGATITGQGNLGLGQSTFTNNGTINANVSGQTLALQPGQGNGDFTNGAAGIAEATNGGTLALVGGTFNGPGFRALNGSTLTIGANANLVGVTLSTAGTGTVTLTDSATLTNVVNNGTLIANNNTTTSLVGTLTNNGTFTLASTGSGDDLRFTGANETLAGTGTLVLSGPSDRLYATNGGGDRLTIGANATIAGNGNLGLGQSTFTNNGTVNANVSGATLTLQPGQGSGDFTSVGVTEATNGGTLALLNGGSFTGPGGFTAANGSTVTLGGNPNVNATTLSSAGTGTVVILDTASLTNVTLAGTVNANNNSTTYLYGTLTNNGTFSLNSTGSGDDLRFVGAAETLAGTGTINLNGPADRVYANNGGGDRLTINAGATVTGTGNLGIGQSTFTNNGTVNANQSSQTLTLQPGQGSGDFTTGLTGVTEATGGGVMVQTGGSFTNNGTYAVVSGGTGGGSSLSVDAGRLTNFSGTTLTGGTYNVVSTSTAATSTLSLGGGTITTNAANVTLSGASTVFAEIAPLAVNQGSFAVANGRNFTTVGALANGGTLVAASSTLTVTGKLTQTSAGTLTGTGTFAASGGFTLSGNVNPGGTVSATTGAFTGGAGTTNLNGDVAFDVNTKFNFELGAITGTNDHLNVTGLLALNGTLNVAALAGFGTGTYDLIDHPITDVVLSGLTLGTLPTGYTYQLLYAPTQVDLVVVRNAVPEPGTWALVLGGATLLLGARRLRRHA